MLSHDVVLETRVLKTLMDVPEANLMPTLQSDWFGMPITREIWERLASLKRNGKAVPTSQTLASDPVLTEKAQLLLKGEVKPFRAAEIEQAVEQLNYYRQGRVLFGMVERVTNICKDQEPDVQKAKVEIEACLRLLQHENAADEILSYGGNNEQVLELYEELLAQQVSDRYVPTGFNVIDKQQGGLARGRLYTFGAPSGGGKSTLVNSIAVNAYLAGHSVAYCSFEMNKGECLLRTQSYVSRIPHDRFQLTHLLTKEDRKNSDKVLAKLLSWGASKDIRLDYVCPRQDINLSQLFSMLENLNHDVVVVDYLNLMAPINPREALWWNMGEGFRLAKRFAERNDKVLMMVVQIDEETGGIKYAKSIKHHSDGIWIWPWTETEKESGVVEIEQVKLRNMKPGKFSLKAEFEYCSFREDFGPGAPVDTVKDKGIAPMQMG